MGMPRKLKGFNVFHNGANFVGEVEELNLPKLKREMEAWQGSGMTGPVKIDYGNEELQLEWPCGGFMVEVLEQYGAVQHDGGLLRFSGGYRREDSKKHDQIEVVVKGRHEEIDMGTAKAKEDTKFKITTNASYYKLTVNGRDLIELDFVNAVEKINGMDLASDLRRAMGL